MHPLSSSHPQLHSFSPVANTQTRVLVVGSMPGRASLEACEYYAHPRNQFWPLMFDLLANGRKPADYRDKLTMLLTHHIGLWDSLASCTRPGSLDTHIRNGRPNDFPALFSRFPAIHTLLFNGKTAYTYFVRAFKQKGFSHSLIYLPSTSPAHAGLSYTQKKHLWQQAFHQTGIIQ